MAANVRHRLAHELHRLGARPLARIVAEIAYAPAGVGTHPGAEIGEGFFTYHGAGVVIGETAVIGRNVLGGDARREELPSRGNGELRKNYPPHPIAEDEDHLCRRCDPGPRHHRGRLAGSGQRPVD